MCYLVQSLDLMCEDKQEMIANYIKILDAKRNTVQPGYIFPVGHSTKTFGVIFDIHEH